MNKDQPRVSSTVHSRAKLTALAPVDSLPFYQRDAEAEKYEGRGDQMWARMGLYTIYQSKEVLSGSYIREKAYRDKSLEESLQEHSNQNI